MFVGAGGRVIAHPDFDMRKSLRALSTLAQVREALTTTALTGTAHVTHEIERSEGCGGLRTRRRTRLAGICGVAD